MDEIEHGHHHETHDHRPYWKHAHRDWRFWIAVVFIFAALAIYVLSDDPVSYTHLDVYKRQGRGDGGTSKRE